MKTIENIPVDESRINDLAAKAKPALPVVGAEKEKLVKRIKELLKEKMIGKDEEHRAEGDIQAVTDKYIAEIDEVLGAKEAELMEI